MSYNYSENNVVQQSPGALLRAEVGLRLDISYNTKVLGENRTIK